MRGLLLAAVFFFSSPVFADYFWIYSDKTGPNFASASAACDAELNYRKAADPTRTFSSTGFVLTDSDKGQCGYRVCTVNGVCFDQSQGLTRGGTPCVAPAVWDETIYGCKIPEDKCSDKNGTSHPFSKSGTAPDGYLKIVSVGGKPMVVKSTEGCFDGCMASTADQKCKTKSSGAYFCQGTAWFDGQSCASSGTPGVDSSSSAQYPEPEQTTDTKPCNYTTNADGTQSCTSSNGTEKEGQICGTISATGEKICVDRPPSKQGLDIATTVKTETDANGNKTTTKTDTATTTKCTDVKVCTSSTTTVTTVIKGDGTATSTCKGANCPDKSTNPDGNGDGFGDCVSGDCGEGQGDDAGGLGLPELEDVPGFGESTQQFVDRVSGSRIANAMGNVRAPGGACPIFQGEAGFLGHLTIDGHCSVIAGNESLIRLAAKTVWALLACWILLG